jgi:hypothetical protein
MTKLSKKERKHRIIAFGEFSDHCHVVTGPAVISREGEEVRIRVSQEAEGEVFLEHLLQSAWESDGTKVSINEKEGGRDGHLPIKLKAGEYKYVQQMEYDMIEEVNRAVYD